MTIDKRSNADLVDDLGLCEYLLERFAVAGTPLECQQRLHELEKAIDVIALVRKNG